MARTRPDGRFGAADALATLAGVALGLTAGLLLGANIGRVNASRIRSALERWRERPGRSRLWTLEAAERLETRVLDALHQDVVLARRPIRVAVLGLGLVELTGRVLHTSEIALAGAAARRVPGVATVLNHLLVARPAGGGEPASKAGAARAARG